jgi:hypothetical protein
MTTRLQAAPEIQALHAKNSQKADQEANTFTRTCVYVHNTPKAKTRVSYLYITNNQFKNNTCVRLTGFGIYKNFWLKKTFSEIIFKTHSQILKVIKSI